MVRLARNVRHQAALAGLLFGTIGWTSILGSGTLAKPACAEVMNRAAEVVHFSPADERQWCIAFTGDGKADDPRGITGLALLRATGLPIVTKSYGSMGEFVCKIGDVGTEVSDCPAKDGSYWAYYHLASNGTWTVSNKGASTYRVHDSGMDGWSWQPVGKGTPPYPTSFGAICPGDAPEASPSPSNAPSESAQTSPPAATSSPGASSSPLAAAQPGTGSLPPGTSIISSSETGWAPSSSSQGPLNAGPQVLGEQERSARYEGAAQKRPSNPLGYVMLGSVGLGLALVRALLARRNKADAR